MVVAEGKKCELNQRAWERVVVVVCGLPQQTQRVLFGWRRRKERLIGGVRFRRGGRKCDGGMECGIHEIES